MVRNIIWIGVVAAFVLLSGCQSGLPAPDNKIAVVFRYDDVSCLSSTDMESKLIDAFRERGVRCTFAVIPGACAGDAQGTAAEDAAPLPAAKVEMLAEAMKAGAVEVALHGYAHENGAGLTEDQERAIFHRAYDVLTRLAGRPPQGNRSPAWDLTPHTLSIIRELGLLYDSSLMSTDYTPFYCRTGDVIVPDGPVRFGSPTEVVELPVSWSLDDYPHFEYLRGVLPGFRAADQVYNNWYDDVLYMLRDFDNGVVVVTFHPQAIGRGHRLLGLERWLDRLADLPITYARLDTVAAAFKAGTPYGVYDPERGSHR